MKILYIGDIMGEAGVGVIESLLPGLINQRQIDIVIAQAENVSGGRGITVKDLRRLQKAGIDFFCGGNWTLYRSEIWPLLSDPNEPIIRPANYPSGTKGLGYKFFNKGKHKLMVVSLLGQVVGKDADKPIDNPLKVVDAILKETKDEPCQAKVVNFHGDYSSEKVIIGEYLDGRVTAVIGDHWHVPTADARILPNGTAHITDVGMCGTLNSSLGVSFDSVVPRWRDDKPTRNLLETKGPRQFNAVLIESDKGLASSIEYIRSVIDDII